MPKTDFSSTEVAELAGITYQTLNRWLKDGVVACDVPATGTGSRRRFTFRDAVLVVLARVLKDIGLTMRGMTSVLNGVRAGWQDQNPDHAGYIAIQHWTDGAIATWDSDPGTLRLFLPSPRRVVSNPDTWTGVVTALDVVFIAKRTLERLGATGAVFPPILGESPDGPEVFTTVQRSYRVDETGTARRVYNDSE